VRSRLVLGFRKLAAQYRRNTQYAEHVRGDNSQRKVNGITHAGERGRTLVVSRRRFQRMVLRTQIHEVRIAERPARLAVSHVHAMDGNDSVGLREGKGPQKHSAYRAKDGGVRANSERQREDDYSAKAGRL